MKPKSFKDITPEELAIVERLKGKSQKTNVYTEDLIEVEFLMKFGFEAYWAIYPNKDRSKGITGREMTRLLVASRKLDIKNMYDAAQAAFIGAGSARSKKPSQTFKSMTKKLITLMKADT